MYGSKSLDEYVIEIFQFYHDKKLHWWQIRNELQLNQSIPSDVRYAKSFSVKLSRSLKRLRKDGYLIREELGHKNTVYSLNKDEREKILKKSGSLVNVSYIFAGIYEVGDSYEKFRTKALKEHMKFFEKYVEPDLKKSFKEAQRIFEREKAKTFII